jgi:hypothetical protein
MQMFARTSKPPLPTPWMDRPVINMPMLIDKPAINDPVKKTKFATSRMGLRPNMSEILPQTGVDAVVASRYEEPIQVKPVDECKSEEIVSRAVVTMVMSRAARKTARPMATIVRATLVLLRSSGGFVPPGG